MSEDQTEKSRWKKFALFCLRNVVNVAFFLFSAYYALLAYVFQVSPTTNKMMLIGVCCLWLIWIFAKAVIKIILALLLVVFVIVGWYHVSHYDEIQCKNNDGVWNAETQSCEEKLSLWQRVQKLWQSRTEVKVEKKSEK